MRWVKWIGWVISAIAVVILIVLFLPVFTMRTDCGAPPGQNTAYNLKNAISAYFTEYREFPLRSPDIDITVDTGERLMDILLGSEVEKEQTGRNPRGIVFYSDKAAKPMEEARFRKGLTLDPQGGGELWDPWGNFYRVLFDSNFDNHVENPEAPGTFLPESILVWSAGKDGDFATWKDNVKTW